MFDIETASVAYRILGMAMFLHIAEAAETLSRRVCLDLRITFLQHFAFHSIASPFFCDVFHKDEYCWTPRYLQLVTCSTTSESSVISYHIMKLGIEVSKSSLTNEGYAITIPSR